MRDLFLILACLPIIEGLGACGGETREGGAGSGVDENGGAGGSDAVPDGAGGSPGGSGGAFGGPGGAGSTGGYPYTCFAAGTSIATPAGDVAIERLRVGDLVLGYDERLGEVVPGAVAHVFVHPDQRAGTLSIADGRTLRVTGEHPIYLPDHGRYVAAENFHGGERLLVLGRSGTRSAIAEEYAPGAGPLTETVYNITVEDVHNYFAEGVLVHNKSGGYPSCVPETRSVAVSECTPREACIDPLAQSGEYVTLNELAGKVDGGAAVGGGADAGPALNGGADAGPALDGGANGGDPVTPAPLGSYQVQLCQPPQAGQTALIAFDAVSVGQYSSYALYTGYEPCSGSSIGEVWLGDHDAPVAGVLQTQCVSVPSDSLGTWLMILGQEEGTLVDNVRFVSGCECVRHRREWTNCGLDPNGQGGSSACE